jgi:hypothetical protein
MKKTTLSAVAATAMAAVAMSMTAPAVAAPTGRESAQQMIEALEAQGHTVITNRVGNTPLAPATVTAGRLGWDVTHHIVQAGEARAVEVLRYRTVCVDLA